MTNTLDADSIFNRAIAVLWECVQGRVEPKIDASHKGTNPYLKWTVVDGDDQNGETIEVLVRSDQKTCATPEGVTMRPDWVAVRHSSHSPLGRTEVKIERRISGTIQAVFLGLTPDLIECVEKARDIHMLAHI